MVAAARHGELLFVILAGMLLSNTRVPQAAVPRGATGSGPQIAGPGGSQVVRFHLGPEDGRCVRVVPRAFAPATRDPRR
jgi:hypothetical protein